MYHGSLSISTHSSDESSRSQSSKDVAMSSFIRRVPDNSNQIKEEEDNLDCFSVNSIDECQSVSSSRVVKSTAALASARERLDGLGHAHSEQRRFNT